LHKSPTTVRRLGVASDLLRARDVRALVVVGLFAVACSSPSRSGPTDAAIDAAAVMPDAPASTPQCTHDTDCPSGHICGSGGACVVGCDRNEDCGSGQSCCDHACIPTDADPDNCGGCGITCGSGGSGACCNGACSTLDTDSDCGACGSACGADDFCSAMQCVAYPSYCTNATVYEIFDGIANDIAAASLMTSTFADNCAPSTAVVTANTTDATLIDQTTGQLLGGSDVTYVLSGGPDADVAVKYLETTAALTKVYLAEPTTGQFAWMVRTSTTPVATLASSSCSAHADQFVAELVTDPSNGTLALIGYGICTGAGTFGAAYFYADVMLPNPTMYPDTWYVVSWADTNNDGIANIGDTFTVLAHGS
jgi:hypothetical protein